MKFIIFSVIFFLTVNLVFAGNVKVENNVSVSAESQNKAEANVKIKTIIDGEIVEDINIHEESTGTPVIIEKKSKVELNKDDENNKNEKNENFLGQIFSRLLSFLSRFKFSLF